MTAVGYGWVLTAQNVPIAAHHDRVSYIRTHIHVLSLALSRLTSARAAPATWAACSCGDLSQRTSRSRQSSTSLSRRRLWKDTEPSRWWLTWLTRRPSTSSCRRAVGRTQSCMPRVVRACWLGVSLRRLKSIAEGLDMKGELSESAFCAALAGTNIFAFPLLLPADARPHSATEQCGRDQSAGTRRSVGGRATLCIRQHRCAAVRTRVAFG